MKTRSLICTSILLTALASTVMAAEGFPSFGISMIDVQSVGPYPTLKVEADGHDYSKASTNKLSFHIQGKGRCQKLHWLNKISMNIQKKNPQNVASQWEPLHILNGPINQKTWTNDWKEYVIKWSPHSSIRTAAVNACNAELSKRIQQGGNRGSILKNGLAVVLTNKAESQLNFACSGPSSNSTHPRHVNDNHKINVECAKYIAPLEPLKKATLAPILQIQQPAISMQSTNYQGICPANLPVKARIKTNGVAGTVQYRFLKDGSPATVWKNLDFAKNTTERNAYYGLKIIKPIPAAPKSKGFKANNQGGAQAKNQLQLMPTHKVSVQVKTATKQMSAMVEYSATCRETTKTTLDLSKLKPDLTSRKGISIGPKSTQWNGTLNLTVNDALSKGPRGCKFRFHYDILNLKNFDSGNFNSKLRANNTVIHTANGLKRLKQQTQEVAGQITLKSGNWGITATIDEGKTVAETNEGNNFFKMKANVAGGCGGTPARVIKRQGAQ